jgi:hypothetical protein
MQCTEFDWKGYVLGELDSAGVSACEGHLQSCAQCRSEVASLRAPVAFLRAIPQAEPPRRITFVSDPVMTTPWWQRFWNAGPKLGFASAAMLSLAILAHGFLARPVSQAASLSPLTEARIHEEARLELERRLPAAVDAAVKDRFKAENQLTLASLKQELAERDKMQSARTEQQIEQNRQADQKAVRYVIERLTQRMNTAMIAYSRPNGGD